VGKRAEHREQKTEQLLDLATRVVAEEGVEALTMHRLAGELGVAVGGLYRYFENKEALVVVLQRRAVDGLRAAVEAALAREPRGAGQKLLALKRVVAVARVWRRQAGDVPERHRFIDAYLSDPRTLLTEEQNSEVEASLQPLVKGVGGAFTEAHAVGALSEGDALLRTHVLWAALHGIDHFEKRDARAPVRLRTEALFKETLRGLLVGWGADAAEVNEALRRG
jgi:AcrR family transcriptional regulator